MARTHGTSCYRGGCRCAEGRAEEARRRSEARAPQRAAKACDICRRVHQGTCVPTDSRSQSITVTLPGRLARRLRDRIGWGDRSAWIAHLIEDALNHLEDHELTNGAEK